ncbi:MAG: TetR/AcrR family transcriptional regulator [Roseivirga sp.]
MKNTRSEIIRNAVSLFNQRGFFKVTVKEIADEMGISPGNLTYHFKKKEHLLAAIQEEILGGSQGIIVPEGQEIRLRHFRDLFARFYEIQSRYCFYFSEIIYLLEVYPEITGEYKETTATRLVDARKLVDYYVATGRLVTEQGDVDYDYLIHNLWMVNTFWTLGGALLNRERAGKDFDSPIESLWKILLPYLTEKGRKEYDDLKAEEKS